MADALSIMLWPLIACLLLPGILVYYGLHIVRREIIFVDLPLAQVAALESWRIRPQPGIARRSRTG